MLLADKYFELYSTLLCVVVLMLFELAVNVALCVSHYFI